MEDLRIPEIAPCPFCGSTKIKHSLKISGRWDVYYHSAMFCTECHTYGPRYLSNKIPHNDYPGRTAIENDITLKIEAIKLWNRRMK